MAPKDPNITFRLATWDDLESLADVSYESLDNHPITAMTYPRRHEYPKGCHAFWYRRHRNNALDPSIHTVVAEIFVNGSETKGEGSKEERKIVGFGAWQKFGKQSIAVKKKDEAFLESHRPSDPLVDYCSPDDPAVDFDGFQIFLNILSSQKEKWASLDPQYADRWHLQLMGVIPAAQRKGIATEIIKWGCRWAEEDGTYASVEAQGVGQKTYLSQGFKILDTDPAKGTASRLMTWEA